jgi:signal transduction histidine kinase
LGYIYVVLGNQQYRSVAQMLYSSRVTPTVLITVAVVLTISLLVTMLYLHRMRVRFDELVNVMGKRFREGDFIVNLSHDLRTPLAIARGYGETLLLKRGELGAAEEQEYMELVVGKIRQVEGMVNQLFELAKIESPSFAAKREPFVFSEMLGEVLRAAGGRDRIGQRGMEDGAWIEADVAMMERVVQNLVVNALAYTPAGGRIAVALEREGDALVFRIENEGRALPADLITWINEAGAAARPAVPAIGLTIVRKMLSLHGYGFGAEVKEGRNYFWVRMGVHTFDTVL